MTVKHALFGIPGNENEFLDEVRKMKQANQLADVVIVDDRNSMGYVAIAVGKDGKQKRFGDKVSYVAADPLAVGCGYEFFSRDEIITNLKKENIEPTMRKALLVK